MAEKREPRVRTPTKGWHEIASGDIGDILHWKPGYEILQGGQSVIGCLGWLDSGKIDWPSLIGGLPRFAALPGILREGYFGFLKWSEIDGFHAIEGEGQEETGSMSGEWTHMWLEMEHSQKRRIFRDFEVLTKRLESYPPLSRYL